MPGMELLIFAACFFTSQGSFARGAGLNARQGTAVLLRLLFYFAGFSGAMSTCAARYEMLFFAACVLPLGNKNGVPEKSTDFPGALFPPRNDKKKALRKNQRAFY